MATTTSKLLDLFEKRTDTSANLAKHSRHVFPSGVTHDSRFFKPHPIYVERALGPRKWDVDGNEYVDFFGGHGAMLLGHAHPRVTAAVQEQAALGTHYGACHRAEIAWGEWVQKLIPSAERVRFTSSGTEATMMALRLARAVSGRKKILRFMGHFHGWHDHVAFGVASHFDGTPTPGVLQRVAEEIVLLPPNDIDRVREVLVQDTDIAAVIIEPTGGSFGQMPAKPGFCEQLRQVTAENDVLLIFDEVVTGFRCAPGGAQQVYSIKPDITTLAKILAGGYPGGAVAGSQEVMQWLDFEATAEDGVREKIPHQGTFNANPVSAVAGSVALEIVATTDACEKANQFAERLRNAFNELFLAESVSSRAYGTFSGFHIFANPDRVEVPKGALDDGSFDFHLIKDSAGSQLAKNLKLGLLAHGVDVFGWPGGVVSCTHGDDEFEHAVEAMRSTLRILKEEGEIGSG